MPANRQGYCTLGQVCRIHQLRLSEKPDFGTLFVAAPFRAANRMSELPQLALRLSPLGRRNLAQRATGVPNARRPGAERHARKKAVRWGGETGAISISLSIARTRARKNVAQAGTRIELLVPI